METTNKYRIKPKSKNQLMALICHLEMLNVPTGTIELEDWKEVSLELSLVYNIDYKSKLINYYSAGIFENEASYQTLGLDKVKFENCNLQRFRDICKLIEVKENG